MLPKQNRFNIRKNFLNLKKKGKMLNSESFGFLFASSERSRPFTTNNNKFNFIVSTKISKKATDRNLIRRRLSEITRELLPNKDISGVFLCKKTIVSKKYDELKKEVEVLIKKIQQ